MTIAQLEKLGAKFKWEKIGETETRSASDDSTFESAVRWNLAFLEPMMKEWAQHVEAYRSDLCYELIGILDGAKMLDTSPDTQNRTEYPLRIIGIRKNGVDHAEYVECQAKDIRKGVYSAVFMVTIERASVYAEGLLFTSRLYRANLCRTKL